MKPQTRYFTAAALLAIGGIAAAALFPRTHRALCGQGGGIWHSTQDYCIRPDCRQQHNCGERAFVPREQCQAIRAGDTLDKAWFILGEPNRTATIGFGKQKAAAKRRKSGLTASGWERFAAEDRKAACVAQRSCEAQMLFSAFQAAFCAAYQRQPH